MWLLAVATLIAGLVRLPGLTILPAGFTPDEAAFGYNAYSLAETGRDEWATPFWQLPFTNLRSFGDYKLPLYAFLAVPTVHFLGLTETATRLPNALLSILAVPILYICARKLAPQSKAIASTVAFLYAISTWSIQLSRGAFEANLVTCLLPLALALSLFKRPIWLSFVFVLTFYSYHSARIISVLTFPIFCYFLQTQAKRLKFAILTLLLIIPGAFAMFGSGASRVSDVSVFNPTDNWAAVSDRRFNAVAVGEPDVFARGFSNKFTYVAKQVSNAYLQYFSPQFFWTQGPGESTYGMMPGRGVLYLLEVVFIIGFCVYVVRYWSKKTGILLTFLLLSPLPAVFAKGPGYAANRAAVMLPFLLLAAAIGCWYLVKKFPHIKLIIAAIVLIYTVQFGFFIQDYLVHSPRQTAYGMNYGWAETLTRSKALFPTVDEVWLDTGLSEPHIFAAFYLKIPPTEYQTASASWADFNASGLKFLDQYDGYRLGKFRFGSLHLDQKPTQSTLYIGRASIFPSNYPEHFHVNYPDGLPAIEVAQSK